MSGGTRAGTGYRTSPRPLAKLAPPAPWWRLAWAWCRGVFRRMERAQARRQWRCPVCDARVCEFCDAGLHS